MEARVVDVQAAPPPRRRRRNLVILRAGDASLHRGWIAEPHRDFDLFISYYGKQPGLHAADAEYYEHRAGPKWPCLGDLLEAHPELLRDYDAFWFPDDDLAATTDTINRMFALFHGFSLALAQPALTPDSYRTWDQLLQRPEYVLRHVAFVEVMAPIFEQSALRACLPTFRLSRSGWGLDWVWPKLAGRGRPDSIAILDATPVRHTRPLGGDLYRNHPDMDPHLDERRLLAQFDVGKHRYTHKHLVRSVVEIRRTPWWQRVLMALRRANGKRLYARERRRSASTSAGASGAQITHDT